MKKVIPMFLFGALLMSCESDDDVIDDGFHGETKEYAVQSAPGSSIEGTILFTENEDGSTTIDLALEGTVEGESYPSSLRLNSAVQGGEIALSLEPVDAPTGASTTTVAELDDETAVSFEDLANFNGHLSVEVAGEEGSQALVAFADLGENQLTGEEYSFALEAVEGSALNGTATFQERENGQTLVSLELEGTEEGASHPAQIMAGSIEEGLDVLAAELNPVDGTTGISQTNVANLNEETQEGAAISYEDLIGYDGHLSVYLNQDDLETILAQGNIISEDAEGTE